MHSVLSTFCSPVANWTSSVLLLQDFSVIASSCLARCDRLCCVVPTISWTTARWSPTPGDPFRRRTALPTGSNLAPRSWAQFMLWQSGGSLFSCCTATSNELCARNVGYDTHNQHEPCNFCKPYANTGGLRALTSCPSGKSPTAPLYAQMSRVPGISWIRPHITGLSRALVVKL